MIIRHYGATRLTPIATLWVWPRCASAAGKVLPCCWKGLYNSRGIRDAADRRGTGGFPSQAEAEAFGLIARVGCVNGGCAIALVPKLHLGTQKLLIVPFASALAVIHKSCQIQKCRHTGRDAGIQAMDGYLKLVLVPHLGIVVGQSLPSSDAGFRHPCRNDGFTAFVYNGERSGVGTQLEPLQRYADAERPRWGFPRRSVGTI